MWNHLYQTNHLLWNYITRYANIFIRLGKLPLMVGSGFLTEAIGEPPATVAGPARPAGLGDPEVARPGESCRTQIKKRDGGHKNLSFSSALTQVQQWGVKKYVTSSPSRFQIWSKVRGLTAAAPLDGVTGCFANKDCRQQILQWVT